MNFKHFTLTFFTFFLAACSFAQNGFEFKLQLMQEELTWGVYMRVIGDEPSGSMVTASGQITVVMPADFEWSDRVNHNGFWDANATVISPIEEVERQYVSFGMVQAEPLYPINYTQADDVLLFTFKGESCPDSLYLIDCNTPNVNDPFCPDFDDDTPLLNSAFSNPGNDLSVLDLGQGGLLYQFMDNFAPSAWNCHDCDNDGIPNAHEDTNGNGVYDPGIDASDYCDGGMDPCAGILPNSATIDGGGAVCAGQSVDIFVQIVEGQGPFDVVINDGNQNIYIDDYESGTPIPVTPTVATQYTLVRIDVGPMCELTTNLSGQAVVTLAEGLGVGVPENTTLINDCVSDPVISTSLDILNPSGATVVHLWEKSCDGGSSWEEVMAPVESFDILITSVLNVLTGPQNDGCIYRMVAEMENCGQFVSENVTYYYDHVDPVLLENPVDVSICEEADEITFSASIEVPEDNGVAFKWFKSCDGGDNWELIPGSISGGPSGVNNSELVINDVNSTDDGCMVRLEYLVGCTFFYTEPATITVSSLPDITVQPIAQESCPGQPVVFHVETDAPSDVFWRKSCDGGLTWQLIFPGLPGYEGSLTPTLTVVSAEYIDDGCLYQALIDDVSTGNLCGTKFTEPAELSILSPPEFVQQPSTQTLCMGETAIFEAGLLDDSSAPDYQWQQSCDGGATWSDLDPADATHNGVFTNTLSVESNDSNTDCQYRLVATAGDCGSAVSESALLNAKRPVEFIEMPTDKVACPDEIVEFSAQADAFGLIDYQWQMSANGIDFEDITFPGVGGFSGYESNVLTVNGVAAVDGYAFRLAGNTNICPDRIYSEAARIAVKSAIDVIASPETVSDCEGESAAFFANIDQAGQTDVQFQWQAMLDGSSIWQNLAEGPNFAGVNTEELFIADNTGLYGARFRLQATGECRTVETSSALLITEDCSIDSNYLEMKIGLLPEGTGWGVYIRLAEDFVPNDYQTAISGRVVIATDAGFGFHSLLSEAAGKWTPGAVALENWQHPDTRYFTFNLEANNNQLLLKPGNEIMLFRFKPIGDCPKQMYIVEDENELPNGLEPCEFNAVDLDENYFYLSNIYDKEAWNCHGSSALMANTSNESMSVSSLDDAVFETAQNIENEPSGELEFAALNQVEGLTLSPNPAIDFVNLQLKTQSENARVHLINLQGQTLETIDVQARTDLQLNLNDLPTGLYFVLFEVDGSVIQREKLVKN